MKLHSFQPRWQPDPSSVARLSSRLVIDGIVHVKHYSNDAVAIYQNYSRDGYHSMFKTYVIQHDGPSEVLGELIGQTSSLDVAISIAAKERP